jgi:hypothetical protein
MAWHRIDPRYLRQQHPGRLTVGYWDPGGLDLGHLLLHLDGGRQVAGFELAYRPFLGGRELFADWSRGRELRIGEVDAGDQPRTTGPRMKASPIVRYYARPPADAVAGLVRYVDANRAALAPGHYAVLVGVLRESIADDS